MYKELEKQYELLSLEEKNLLLIYKSRLFDFINRIDLIMNNMQIKNLYNEKYVEFKRIINLPENSFIKYSIFSNISLNTYDSFLNSIKEIQEKIINIPKIIIPKNIKVYRAVTVTDLNDIYKISTSNLISTSLDVEVTDSFYTNNGQDILYQINLHENTPCLIVPYSIKIYENDGKQVLKVQKNDSQKEIILFKDFLNYEITSKQYIEEENLLIVKIETSYNKNITK